MFFIQNKYFDLITPMSYLVDLLVINLFPYFLPINFQTPLLFHAYISLGWAAISIRNKFYKVHRYAKVAYVLRLLFVQFMFFFLVLYAFIGFFKQPIISRLALGQYFVFVSLVVFTIKMLSYVLLMRYREKVDGNSISVVVIGKNSKTDQLVKVFKERTEFGYHF
ncbi:MAG: undecaprenyl-phosphate glucose phosphotransferase, partial [Bacteroidota bacterium]